MTRNSRLMLSFVAILGLASSICGQGHPSPHRKKPELPRAEIGLGLGLPHLVHLGASISPWKPVFVEGEIAQGMLAGLSSHAQLVAGYQRIGEDGAAWRFGLGYGTGSRGTFNGANSAWDGAIASMSKVGLFDAMNGRWGYKAALSVGAAWDRHRRSYVVPLNGAFGLFVRIL